LHARVAALIDEAVTSKSPDATPDGFIYRRIGKAAGPIA
jgi:PqqA peptide cyclase